MSIISTFEYKCSSFRWNNLTKYLIWDIIHWFYSPLFWFFLTLLMCGRPWSGNAAPNSLFARHKTMLHNTYYYYKFLHVSLFVPSVTSHKTFVKTLCIVAPFRFYPWWKRSGEFVKLLPINIDLSGHLWNLEGSCVGLYLKKKKKKKKPNKHKYRKMNKQTNKQTNKLWKVWWLASLDYQFYFQPWFYPLK